MLYRFYHHGVRVTIDAPSHKVARQKLRAIKADFAGELRKGNKRHKRPLAGMVGLTAEMVARSVVASCDNVIHLENVQAKLLNAHDTGFELGCARIAGHAKRRALAGLNSQECRAFKHGYNSGVRAS